MTIIVEYRVPMPLSAAEYQIGQLYTIAKKSRLESSAATTTTTTAPDDGAKTAPTGGNHLSAGVQINANEPYSDGPGGSGQYTNKTYFLAHRIPDCLKRLLPESAGKLNEEAWNAYPYSRNRFTCPMLDKLSLEIESRYLDGPPVEANVFGLEPKEEEARSIVVLDLVRQERPNKTHRAPDGRQVFSERDLLNFRPLKRPPLTQNWLQEYEMAAEDGAAGDASDAGDAASKPGRQLMTCYKLCRISFPVWALQSKVEQFIQNFCRDTIVEAHRLTWLWQDEWAGMSLEEIRMMERATQAHLNELGRRESSIAN